MINFFLRIKHWQLFIVMTGIPLLMQGYIQYEVFTNVYSTVLEARYSGNPPVNPFEFFDTIQQFLNYLFILLIIPIAFQFGWMWSIGTGLQSQLPEGVKMNVGLYKTFLILPLIYGFAILWWVSSFIGQIETMVMNNQAPDMSMIGWFFLFFPVHLFIVFCQFYTFWFAAKTVKSIELGKNAKFEDFMGEFFLFWFNFVGVWVIQPKINKMVKGEFEVKREEQGWK